jgi:NAD(P)-dependent dehydrogenase (short-subunit alcohol dehydrogenase family)
MNSRYEPGGARLAGRSALITGAAKGIGLATARVFADQGAHLVIQDVDGEELAVQCQLLRDKGAQVEAVVGDVSRPYDVHRAVLAAVRRHGRLDIAVANAGIIPLQDILHTTVEDWEKVMAVDARGAFLTCKYAIEAMTRTGGGAIVCVSSISGLAGQRGQASYGPAKFVATGLVKHLAVEWADRGIRVNGVAPGTIRTDRVRQLETEPGGAEYLRDIEARHPMGRLGDPEEVATAIAFLASDEASFITGVVLPVDGGYLAQ